jgi:hypothetical protein
MLCAGQHRVIKGELTRSRDSTRGEPKYRNAPTASLWIRCVRARVAGRIWPILQLIFSNCKFKKMNDDSGITVYFVCSTCSLLYVAKQMRRSEEVSGSIDCLRCRRAMHHWSGLYDFVAWRPVRNEIPRCTINIMT